MGHAAQAHPLRRAGTRRRDLFARGWRRRAPAEADARRAIGLFGRFGDRLVLRLRDGPEVGLVRLPAAGEFLLRSLVAERRSDDAVVALVPVHRGATGYFAVS